MDNGFIGNVKLTLNCNGPDNDPKYHNSIYISGVFKDDEYVNLHDLISCMYWYSSKQFDPVVSKGRMDKLTDIIVDLQYHHYKVIPYEDEQELYDIFSLIKHFCYHPKSDFITKLSKRYTFQFNC